MRIPDSPVSGWCLRSHLSATLMESDWEKFQTLVPTLRERYLAERNARLIHGLTAPGKTETERFWETAETLKQEAATLRRCIDGHSRSNMWIALVTMRAAGMIRPEDLADFSEELQRRVFHDDIRT